MLLHAYALADAERGGLDAGVEHDELDNLLLSA